MCKCIVSLINYIDIVYNKSNIFSIFDVKKFSYLLETTTIIQTRFNEYVADLDEENGEDSGDETYEENESKIDLKFDEDNENHEDEYELD